MDIRNKEINMILSKKTATYALTVLFSLSFSVESMARRGKGELKVPEASRAGQQINTSRNGSTRNRGGFGRPRMTETAGAVSAALYTPAQAINSLSKATVNAPVVAPKAIELVKDGVEGPYGLSQGQHEVLLRVAQRLDQICSPASGCLVPSRQQLFSSFMHYGVEKPEQLGPCKKPN